MADPYRTPPPLADDTEEIRSFVRAVHRDPTSLEGLVLIAVSHLWSEWERRRIQRSRRERCGRLA
jgi:hypothetical protein